MIFKLRQWSKKCNSYKLLFSICCVNKRYNCWTPLQILIYDSDIPQIHPMMLVLNQKVNCT